MVSRALADMGAEHVIFNQRRFAESSFSFTLANGRLSGYLRISGRDYDLDAISGVYSRLTDENVLPELRSLPPEAPQRQQCHNLHDALSQWLEITPARVVNRTRPMCSNCSKPYQTQLIAQLGFNIPETLITNDPELVEDFYSRHERVIYKSISGVRSVVQELSLDDLTRLEKIRWCPTQFQVFIEGSNTRVHVIGQKVFATKIVSDITDYRYAQRQGGEIQMTAVNLSDDLSERCIRLAENLELPFAGIDLKITPEGKVFCFEVNPSPGFTYYEHHTGQPIASAVASYLTEIE